MTEKNSTENAAVVEEREGDLLTAYVASLKDVLAVAEKMRDGTYNLTSADDALTDIIKDGLSKIRGLYKPGSQETEQ